MKKKKRKTKPGAIDDNAKRRIKERRKKMMDRLKQIGGTKRKRKQK
jgi:hypothetical protein